MVTFYDTQQEARRDAAARGLREKVVCLVTRAGPGGPALLVFDHIPDGGAGVQVVAGGVEPEETPERAATRELHEESGLSLTHPTFLTSYLWKAQLPGRFTRQVCHAYALTAAAGTPDTWDHLAEGRYVFRFRWAPLPSPGLDWELDAALPHLNQLLHKELQA